MAISRSKNAQLEKLTSEHAAMVARVKQLEQERNDAQANYAMADAELKRITADRDAVNAEKIKLAGDKGRLVESMEKAATTLKEQARQLLANREQIAAAEQAIEDFERRRKKDADRLNELDDILACHEKKYAGLAKMHQDLILERAALADRVDRLIASKWLAIVAAVLALLFAFASRASAQQTAPYQWDDPKLSLHVPQEILQKFRNPDGSCVQCSNGMTGTDQNIGAFAYLLWDSEYGKKVRGGSSPSRVANYARERNVRIYNVTGKTTWDWMKWACLNGRGAAIGAGGNHFQTLVGYDPPSQKWYVVNNNGDQRIQEYDDAAFRRLHLASGQWCVILDYPPAPAPARIVEWWREEQVTSANPPPSE
jgi:hypothetical protein